MFFDYQGTAKDIQGKEVWPVTTYSKGFFVRGIALSAAALVAMVMRLVISNGAPSEKLFSQ